jgi:leucyl-tRNA synthetase
MHAEQYSADAMRMALADASDSNDDGNFEESIANACILRLTKELAWVEETLAAISSGGLRPAMEQCNLADRVFKNAISHAAAAARVAYEGMLLREALKAGVYDLHIARSVACIVSLFSMGVFNRVWK